jgi:serine protease Do
MKKMIRSGKLKSVTLSLGIVLILACITACAKSSEPLPLPVPTDKVMVKNGYFNPTSVLVTAGMSVTWNNQDETSYVISDNDQRFAFTLPSKGSFNLTLTNPGTYDYHCAADPTRQGTVVVMSGTISKFSDDTLSGVDDLISKVRPSVVSVEAEVISKDIWGRPINLKLEGTGWILDNSGLVVTNNHVVEGAKSVKITLENGQSYSTKIIRNDPINDLAVISIEAANLQPIEMGDSSLIKIGDPVVALGNTLGQGIVATQGIISNTGSIFTDDQGETLYDVLQTTAPINHGNSGGPLINMNGQVIGITTAARIIPAGKMETAYAIGSSVAKPVIHQLVLNGFVNRGVLGVTTSSVAELILRGYQPAVDKGAFITRINAGSAAEKAGLNNGDIILSVGGKEIITADDMVERVRSSPGGRPVEISYWRNNELRTTTAVLVQDQTNW